jgi:hypothetical protein
MVGEERFTEMFPHDPTQWKFLGEGVLLGVILMALHHSFRK